MLFKGSGKSEDLFEDNDESNKFPDLEEKYIPIDGIFKERSLKLKPSPELSNNGSLGVYLFDTSTGKKYEGRIVLSNMDSQREDANLREYDLIVRGISEKGVVTLKESVSDEDMIHFQVKHPRISTRPNGQFLSYKVFIKSQNGFCFEPGDYVFGKVLRSHGNNLYVKPILGRSLESDVKPINPSVSKGRYERFRNVVIRDPVKD